MAAKAMPPESSRNYNGIPLRCKDGTECVANGILTLVEVEEETFPYPHIQKVIFAGSLGFVRPAHTQTP